MYDWIDIHFHKASARILHFRFLSSSCSWHFCDFVCILPKFLDYTSLLLKKTVCLIWPKRCTLAFHAEWWHYHAEIFIFRPCYDRKTFLGFCMFLTVVWMSVQVFLSGVVVENSRLQGREYFEHVAWHAESNLWSAFVTRCDATGPKLGTFVATVDGQI